MAKKSAGTHRRMKYVPNFKDVEESMDTFSGDGETKVQRWIKEFEDTAELCEWSEVQKWIYAKRLLRGSAKIFVNYEGCGKSWKKLKKALLAEFAISVNSHEVHKRLSQRKKKSNETYQEYVYEMLAIAAQVDMETDAVIQYVIDGIRDEEANKAILYGARNIRELKDKLHQYEKMKANSRSKVAYSEEAKKKLPMQSPAEEKRCFSCGDKSHMSAVCPSKAKGLKCFRCNEFGHIAAKCPKKNSCNTTQVGKNKFHKDVIIANCKLNSLIDTGSDISLIRASQYVKIGAPCMQGQAIQFRGVGCDNNVTLGETRVEIDIDGQFFEIILHVVSDALLPYDLIIGSDFLRGVEFYQKNGNISISKIVSETHDVPDVFAVDLFEEDNEFPEIDVKDCKVKDDIEKLVTDYKAQKIRDVDVKMRIVLKDEIPVWQAPRRLSQVEKEEVNSQLQKWLNDGIIKQSYSDYASPIVLVKKADGSTRICVDYRKLNTKIIKDRYPLPLMEDQLDRLQDAKFFSTIDLKNGFFHTSIEASSTKYTAFVVPDGHFEFLRVPFGLCNSPSIFQRYINAVFRDLLAAGIVLIYIDDLIIPSTDYNEGLINLKKVLKTASEHGLSINWKKCCFLQERVEYLGYVVENGCIQPSDRKTLAVRNFPQPGNLKSVQSFLGLTGYFRKFVPKYSLIARPLTNLLRDKVKFQFEKEEICAFNKLKQVLIDKPVLRLYRPKADTELHTDACQLGYGAILVQRDTEDGKFHPVHYISGKTNASEERYTSYELEVLAIVKALKRLRVYLLGINFTIVTDCQAFAQTLKKKDLCPRVARWALMIEEFNYQIEHRPGRNMTHVDALSRNPLPSAMLIDEDDDGMLIRLQSAQNKDKELKEIIDSVSQNAVDGYAMKNGILHKQTDRGMLIVVPKAMQTNIIRKAHERGHFAVAKTEKLIGKDYWFKKMRIKIERVVRNCIDCILAEKKIGKQEGWLHAIDKGEKPLDTYHVDHLGPISSTRKGYQYIFAVVDSFTKFVWIYSTKSTDTKGVLDRLRKQSAIFGNPRRIISDRGTAFTSNEFQEYCKEEGIEHKLITAGVPRGNGQIERVNRTLIPLLTKLASPKPDEWYKFTDRAQKYLNSIPSRSTGFAPFDLLIGPRMRLKEDPQIMELLEKENAIFWEDKRDEIRRQAKDAISRIQEENRRNYNKKRKKPTIYDVGSLVAIKRTQQGPGLKLRPKFLGPYCIIKVLRGDRYVVEKTGEHEGPKSTSTSADNMKPWIDNCSDYSSVYEDDVTAEDGCKTQDGRV